MKHLVVLVAGLGLVLAACGAAPSARGGHSPGESSSPAPAGSRSPAPSATPTPNGPLSNTAAPSDLADFTVGYDPLGKVLILQAGETYSGPGQPQTLVAETWAWDGTTWSRLSPATEPPAEREAAMAVDPISGRLMLMGGDSFTETVNAQHQNVPDWSPNDGTWLWDGAEWTRVADNARQGGDPALAVDQATGQLLVNSPDIRGVLTTDDLEAEGPAWYGQGSYVWTGSGWLPAATNGQVFHTLRSAIAYDPISKRLIQFGGSEQSVTSQTQAYDGTGWTLLDPQTIPTPGSAIAATDEAAGQIVMVTLSPDHPALLATWTWNGSNWVRLLVNEPPSNILKLGHAQLVWDPALGRLVMVGEAGAANSQVQMWDWTGTSGGWASIPS